MDEEAITCWVCARACRLSEGQLGSCQRYILNQGRIQERASHRYLVTCPISIETMPILHFSPKAKFLQVSSTGCNLDCPGCVSTVFVKELPADSPALTPRSAAELIAMAKAQACLGICFVMNDPLASFFSFLELAREAKGAGLLVGCSTNAYFTEESLSALAPYLDFVNIGMKGFSQEAYARCHAASPKPVLRSLERLHRLGVHIEVSCAYEAGREEELRALCRHLAGVDRGIPFQIMRFMPLEQADKAQEPGIAQSEALCRELSGILDYVYLFNTPGSELLDSLCPGCGQALVKRDFYGPMGAKTRQILFDPRTRLCPSCFRPVDIRGELGQPDFAEGAFLGGYPFTRALEMIEAIALALGIKDRGQVAKLWESVIHGQGFEALHTAIQSVPAYLGLIGEYGRLCGRAGEARALTDYLDTLSRDVARRLQGLAERPKVYYVMAKPLFCLNPERFENHLVELAGGDSVNKLLGANGRPGMRVSQAELEAIDPDVIFISSFFSSDLEDFYADCRRLGLRLGALRSRRVYCHPYPNIDFGSPRWALGLMHIANCLHPNLFAYDLGREAVDFYRRFYGRAFEPESLNLSFAKPYKQWAWDDGAVAARGVV